MVEAIKQVLGRYLLGVAIAGAKSMVPVHAFPAGTVTVCTCMCTRTRTHMDHARQANYADCQPTHVTDYNTIHYFVYTFGEKSTNVVTAVQFRQSHRGESKCPGHVQGRVRGAAYQTRENMHMLMPHWWCQHCTYGCVHRLRGVLKLVHQGPEIVILQTCTRGGYQRP